jgi:type IV fimbrial biogenesis protein FimT
MRNISRPARGFTLVEIMVTISILAILAGLAMPMYGSIVAANRTRAASYSLVSALALARSEAVKRNAAVSVLPSDTGWQGGWRVEVAGSALSANGPVNGLALTGPIAGVSYQPNGRLSTPGIVRFVVAAESGYTRCVTIDLGGRASLNPAEHHDGHCG